jgi:hypothetical protein
MDGQGRKQTGVLQRKVLGGIFGLHMKQGNRENT